MLTSIKKYIDEHLDKYQFPQIYNNLFSDYNNHDIKFVLLVDYNYDIDTDYKKDMYECEKRNYQQLLRQKTLQRYNGKCVISGISEINRLETAHIKPVYLCDNINDKKNIDNTLLLWMDIHKYFDDYQISINPNTCKIEVNLNNKDNLWMKEYDGKMIDNLNNDTLGYLESHYKCFTERKID